MQLEDMPGVSMQPIESYPLLLTSVFPAAVSSAIVASLSTQLTRDDTGSSIRSNLAHLASHLSFEKIFGCMPTHQI